MREAADGLRGTKKKKSRRGRLLVLGLVGGALALALSEGLRKKVLDALFGAEEEFEYTASTTPEPSSSDERVPRPARRHDLTEPVDSSVRGGATSAPSAFETGSSRRAPAGQPARLAPVEASVETPRRLEGEKAQRIIAAMRSSVGRRGAAGSTFDHVAREAGVSRGLLHYYFGSKERLLVEVVRQDCDVRNQAMEERLAEAHTIDAIVAALVLGLEEFIEDERANRPSSTSC